MFTLGIEFAKQHFFDAAKVKKLVDKAARQQLSKFGAYVRQRAKTSIRTSKKVSKPGGPPSSHTGLLKKFIFFSYDTAKQTVVIGPVRINKPTGAPKTLEFGGAAVIVGRGGRKTMHHYRARPYMRPAFETELTKMPALWANSVR